MNGQTGLINMPDARIESDGIFRFGAGYFDPYQPFWASVTVLPYIELSGRYTRIRGLSTRGPGGFEDKGFGDYKDKAFDTKAILLKEGSWWPNVALGWQDFTGTGLFSAKYGVLSKRLGNTDYSLGYGSDRIDGLFGGMRHYSRLLPGLALVAEYDAYDYKHDFRADESGAVDRKGGWTWGAEYRWGWLGARVADQDGDFGVNAWVSVPLMEKEFVPKIYEPAPYTREVPKASIDQWLADTGYAARLARTLNERGFRDIRLAFDGHTLSASLTNTRISQTGRAVGRAARILMALGPEGTQEIEILYTVEGVPAVSYRFTDTHKLERYFEGLLSRQQLDHYLEIGYADPLQGERLAADEIDIPRGEGSAFLEGIHRTDEGYLLSFRREFTDLSSIQLIPFSVDVFFNDRNGAARFDLYSTLNYRKQIGDGRFFESSVRASLYENVSNVAQENDSELPHVRSDIGKYLKDSKRVRLDKLLLNQYLQPAERVYARLSAGIYEMMFAGAGGQLLYLPEQGDWAADVSLDWLRQRDTRGGLYFQSYTTVMALGALHYRLPGWGLTATVRAGRFLAKDKGVRFELKRRFRSGITFGGWYTITDGDDTTGPGSPGDPYYDKGIFASIPLGSMLPKDTRARAEFSLRPWSRDVGQMVKSPGDLYTAFERTLMLDNGDYGLDSLLGQ